MRVRMAKKQKNKKASKLTKTSKQKTESSSKEDFVIKGKPKAILLKLFLLAALLYGIYHLISVNFYEGLSIVSLVILVWLLVQLVIELRKK
jgi:hypothetical protein